MSRSTKIARAAPTRRLLLEVAEAAEELAVEARKVAEDYSWGERTRHDLRIVTDAAHVKTGASDPTGAQALSGLPPAKGDDGQGDPDGRTRGEVMTILVRKAIRKITAGTSRFKEGRDLLEDALDMADPNRHSEEDEPKKKRFPKLVKDEELADYASAKERRTDRGEDWGEG